MAPISKFTSLPLKKRFLSQIWTPATTTHPLPSSSTPLILSFLNLRTVHTSVYDKNFDEKIRNNNIVSDEAVEPLSEKHWAPHPQTGVFGPQTEQSAAAVGTGNVGAGDGGEGSVLEQKAWFRHNSLEDSEKHHPHGP